MPRVTIIQRIIPHYRILFFAMLADRLCESGITLRVVHGQEYPGTVPKGTTLDAPWSCRIQNRYYHIRGLEFVWQPCFPALRGSDLIVIEQANRLLINYPLLARVGTGRAKIAYWGHGRNLHVIVGGWRENLKRALVRRADWWFAYTALSATTVHAAGFPEKWITVVQNTIDNEALGNSIRSLSTERIEALRAELGIRSDHVGLYCGSMYQDKRIDFLLDACLAIHERLASFEMIFIGVGPEQHKVEAFVCERPWAHYVGAKFGPDRAPYFALAHLLLMPSMVGLAIVDSFVAGVPIVTTDMPAHGPEIAYLEPDINGVLTPNDVQSYAGAVCGYLLDRQKLERLCQGCAYAAARYTMRNMVDNFVDGIGRCLAEGSGCCEHPVSPRIVVHSPTVAREREGGQRAGRQSRFADKARASARAFGRCR